MPSVTGFISFNVLFDFTGAVPGIILSPSSTLPGIDQPNLIGNFTVIQPDGLPLVGAAGQVAWTGSGYNTITVPLTLASDYTYQKGTYQIIFFAACTGYTYGTFTRTWDMEYLPVTQVITANFDLFIPILQYLDATNYQVGGFIIASQTSAWTATAAAGIITPSSTSLFDLAIAGSYYDSTYYVTYIKNVVYTSSWLSVQQKYTYTVTGNAYIPQTMQVLLTYLTSLKTAVDLVGCYTPLQELYEDAQTLYGHMRARVCAVQTTGLNTYFNQYYLLTHNYQPLVYNNTNAIIPAYDFTTGCGGSGGTGVTAVVIEGIIGNTPVVTGGFAVVTGFTAGSTVIVSNDLLNKRVKVIRGSVNLPGIDPLDGSDYQTKPLGANSITFQSKLITGEYLRIETIP